MEDRNFFNFWQSDWAVFGFVVLIIFIASVWRIFEKAGKPGWAALIPFYNLIIFLEVVGKPWWWLLLILFVPLGNLIFGIWAINLLSKSFGKSALFTVGLIFLSVIFYPVLGFGNAEYKGPAGKQTV